MQPRTEKYCENLFHYKRRPTHEVRVGDVGIGGNNPIRIQSMTISDTMDTAATVREVIQLAEAGCEIVRITAPSQKEAENLREIKRQVRKAGVRVPLVADIHYTPNAALIAAEIVEKVRINPGNYADKKKFEVREYTDAEYQEELQRIYERFAPLVKKCKENGVAMRIGVNHGSLSDRIMNRYGDTPEGMVQSALEFLAICEDLGYRDVVLSMKASNPRVMIQAYRLLAARMYTLGMTYPFHLGVTEAGDGEDGRVKSAVGIGALLEDGIGDTIRVSLTEDAIYEIPVAKALVEKFNRRWQLP
ncbi:MAG: 4-hydroxy-3-methylbut-2-en-1-yl diphosphate synthase, partial [Calditrichaeota bacterium]